MVNYTFQKFTVNGVDYAGSLVGANVQLPLTITQDTVVLASYLEVQTPGDTLLLTKGAYTIWSSGTLGDFYVKLNGVEQMRFLTLEEAVAYVDSKSGSIVKVAALAGVGVGIYIILTRV